MELPPMRLNKFGEQIFERDDTKEETHLKKILLPAKDVRAIIPRVCATCAYGRTINGTFDCLREGGHSCDVGDLEHWLHVCDGYKIGNWSAV